MSMKLSTKNSVVLDKPWTEDQLQGFYAFVAENGGEVLFVDRLNYGLNFVIKSPDGEPPLWGTGMVERYARRLRHLEK